VRHEIIGRGLRALRHRRNLRQRDVSRSARVARSVISDLEAGRLEHHTVAALIRTTEALGAWIRIDLAVPGGDVYRLLDADHAALQNRWMEWLQRIGWSVEAEVTFNHFGERGSIDLLAWDADARTLVMIEVKTAIVDVQALLAGVDRKARISWAIAAERGWAPVAIVPALLVAEGSTARRRLREHSAVFARFASRGRAAAAWLRRPESPAPSGLLIITKLSPARRGDARRAGRQRVRSSRA
jgi:transcriptional regulator with XRE-family HTH domain